MRRGFRLSVASNSKGFSEGYDVDYTVSEAETKAGREKIRLRDSSHPAHLSLPLQAPEQDTSHHLLLTFIRIHLDSLKAVARLRCFHFFPQAVVDRS